jgi:retron-type reverse transcriptase
MSSEGPRIRLAGAGFKQLGTRPLGIPTVADRIAQMVAKRHLDPILEEHFHPDSYGYRSKKSAIEAIGVRF